MPSNLIFHCNSSAAYDILVTESGELELEPSYVPVMCLLNCHRNLLAIVRHLTAVIGSWLNYANERQSL